MLGSNSFKDIENQTPEEKMYLLKLTANQMLGAKWIYYRKIKRGDKGFNVFKEKSLMEQMKATRSALRFTTKTARKLYRAAYQECVKEIKDNTDLKEGFPKLPEIIEGQDTPSLTSEFDAVIISWTPIKFLTPAELIRSKGKATQRHSEGLIAKLFFKVVGYYADPRNWENGKLTLYLRKINKQSTHQEIVAALEPLKNDLRKFSDSYELFKFGKGTLSKDIAQDADAFDDAMGVESFESQVKSLYWYNTIHRAMELFLFRYYLTLLTATASTDAVRYIASIFEPVLAKSIENKNMFLGSFEIDRTKKEFRLPYQQLVQQKLKEPFKKMIKTKEGIFETYSYNLPMLENVTISPKLETVPAENSEWWNFVRHYILNIDRPARKPDLIEELLPTTTKDGKLQINLEEVREKLDEEGKNLDDRKMKLEAVKKKLKVKEKQNGKNQDIKDEEKNVLIQKEGRRIDKERQNLEVKYRKLKEKIDKEEHKRLDIEKREQGKLPELEKIEREDREITELETRQYVLMQIMTTMINCSFFRRQARYNILERFKLRVKTDQELEVKRIKEIRQKAEKKTRELKRKLAKFERLKQKDTVDTVTQDIKKFEENVEQKLKTISQNTKEEFNQQKARLNSLFQEVSKEKSIDPSGTGRIVMKLARRIETGRDFAEAFPAFIVQSIENQYSKDLEPFYKNLFNICDLPIKKKVYVIQSLEKTGDPNAVKLSLDEKEKEQFENLIANLKADIEKATPDAFDNKVIFSTSLVAIKDLLKMSIDNRSLQNLLCLKIASSKTTKSINFNADTIRAIVELNKVVNPLPKNNIANEGMEKDKNPEKRINAASFNNLVRQLG